MVFKKRYFEHYDKTMKKTTTNHQKKPSKEYKVSAIISDFQIVLLLIILSELRSDLFYGLVLGLWHAEEDVEYEEQLDDDEDDENVGSNCLL